MRSITGLGRTVVNWQLLNDNIKPHLAEMPQVQPIAVELEALIAEIRALDNEQEVARMRFRELTRRRRDAEKKGEALRRRVAAHLRGTFGFTSEQLIQFGSTLVRPGSGGAASRRSRRRRLPPSPPPGRSVIHINGRSRGAATPPFCYPPDAPQV